MLAAKSQRTAGQPVPKELLHALSWVPLIQRGLLISAVFHPGSLGGELLAVASAPRHLSVQTSRFYRESKTQRRQGCSQSHTAYSCPSLAWCLGFLIPSPGLLKSPPDLARVPALGWLNPEFLHYALTGPIAKSMKPLLSGDGGG